MINDANGKKSQQLYFRSQRGRHVLIGIEILVFAAVLLLGGVCWSLYQKKSNFEWSSETEIDAREGRWIYYGSHADAQMKDTDRQYLDDSIEKWTNGKLADDELSEWMQSCVKASAYTIQDVGVMSRQTCLFDEESEVPDYEARLEQANGIYEFIGLYTEGQLNEEGQLICEYWEAGVR